jgi:GNAT superfamily N-acetyltransferase
MIEVRLARQTDATELARLSSLLGYPIAEDELAKILAILEADDDHAVLVVEKESALLAGFGHVFLTRRLFLAPFAELGGLIVDEDSRGEGVGGVLLEAVEQWAQEQGASVMRIRSNEHRKNAKDFYLNMGYQVSKKQNVFTKLISK